MNPDEVIIVEVTSPQNIIVEPSSPASDVIVSETIVEVTDVSIAPSLVDVEGSEVILVEMFTGLAGKDGKSAYQVAVDNGFVGTEAEWLESLNGASAVQEVNPSFSYDGDGNLQTVTYDSGTTKSFTYSADGLLWLDTISSSGTYRKEFIYNVDGSLSHIIEGYI